MTEGAGTIDSFEKFWPFYVSVHVRPITRVFHAAGSVLGTLCFFVGVITGRWWLVPIAFVVGYAFAWFSHFVFEANMPATFTYPLYSFRADWKMFGLLLRGRMGSEVARVLAERGPVR